MVWGRLIVAGFALLLVSCTPGEQPYETSLPYAPVRVSLDLYGEDVSLQTPMTVRFIDVQHYSAERLGHAGVMVVHTLGQARNVSARFSAFDMACPYDYPTIVGVEPYVGTEVALGVICPRCGSVYDLSYGWGIPISGPSTTPLQRYDLREGEDGHLYISN